MSFSASGFNPMVAARAALSLGVSREGRADAVEGAALAEQWSLVEEILELGVTQWSARAALVEAVKACQVRLVLVLSTDTIFCLSEEISPY